MGILKKTLIRSVMCWKLKYWFHIKHGNALGRTIIEDLVLGGQQGKLLWTQDIKRHEGCEYL